MQMQRMGMWTWGSGESGANGEHCPDTHVLPRVKQIASGELPYSTGSSAPCSAMTWGRREAGRETQEEGNVCIHIADSHCCKTETQTTRQSDYTPPTTTTTTTKTRKCRQGEGEPKLELIISFFKVRTPINSSLSLLFTATLQLFYVMCRTEIMRNSSLDTMALLWKLPLEKEGHLRSQRNSDVAARKREFPDLGKVLG